MKLMASLPYPVLFTCNPLLVKQFPPIFLLATTCIFKASRWSFTFLTIREALPLSDRWIAFDTITLHFERTFSIKFFKDNIPFKISWDVSFTELLVPLCKIMLSGFFFSKGFRQLYISWVVALGKMRTLTLLFPDIRCSSIPAYIKSLTIKVMPFFHYLIELTFSTFIMVRYSVSVGIRF